LHLAGAALLTALLLAPLSSRLFELLPFCVFVVLAGFAVRFEASLAGARAFEGAAFLWDWALSSFFLVAAFATSIGMSAAPNRQTAQKRLNTYFIGWGEGSRWGRLKTKGVFSH
jgi:hypothetical protein